MPAYTKESLETLRQRIDLVDVLSSHIDFKKSGAAYKALCPFHDEKTPSFMIQKGDTHYHCYGCGAHGDAIQFLMTHLKLNFVGAVEALAQRFNVHLEVTDEKERKGPNKAALKDSLEHASHFYHFILLHTLEGHQALHYLYKRGIDLDFIKSYQIGLAPAQGGILRKYLHSKFVKDETMIEAGLLSQSDKGYTREFFTDRITFPIRDATGSVIGFSARKYREETFGGKYINTPETPLFKKSRVLFGLNYSRKRIAKERKAIIVEGQIDALRLIHAGFNITVAGQGTAFGEGHVKELTTLGVNQVFLALDNDEAGKTATRKIGDLFQKEGVGVKIVELPPGKDPDALLREEGPEQFLKLLEYSDDYISFLVKQLSPKYDIRTPAGKNELLKEIIRQIRSWEQPVIVHESLRRLAFLTRTPEEMVGVGQEHVPNIYIKTKGNIVLPQINHDRILESDLLHWLLLMGDTSPHFVQVAQQNLKEEHFNDLSCRTLYHAFVSTYSVGKKCDLLALAIAAGQNEAQDLISEILLKRVNKDRAEEHFVESIQKLLNRNWMAEREAVKQKIHSGQFSDDEVTELAKQFDALKHAIPKVRVVDKAKSAPGTVLA